MAQTLHTLSIISFSVAGVCLALSVFLWLYFKIPTIISDLSGRTARKSIAKMREINEKTGVKYYKESKVNVERGKLTGTIPDSSKLKPKTFVDDNKPETGLLAANLAEGLESETTGVLGSKTTGLLIDENATAPLRIPVHKPATRTVENKLEILEEVMLIHTDEVI